MTDFDELAEVVRFRVRKRFATHSEVEDLAQEAVIAAWKFYMDGKPFIGGDHASIADIRLAATLEFLAAIDYPLPAWAKDYIGRMENDLGAAYAEPAADVRGYIAYVRGQ